MNRVPTADWAAQVPWSGILNLPSWIKPGGPVVDLSQLTWNGAPPGYVYWNGSRFISVTISGGGSSGDQIAPGEEPAIAVRRRPPGSPSGEFQNIWARLNFNVRLYGAVGNNGVDDLQAFNQAIFDLNSSGGGTLVIPAGNYLLSQSPNQINVPARIQGEGIGVSILFFTGSKGLSFSASTSDWFGVDHLSIEGCTIGVQTFLGRMDAHDLAIEASSRCILIGSGIGQALNGGSVRNAFFTSAGTSAVAIEAWGSEMDFSGLQILADGLGWDQGIELFAGSSNQIHDCYISDCARAAIFLGTSIHDSRVDNVACTQIAGTALVDNRGANNYVNELMGLGANTDTRFDQRKEIFARFAWSPGTVAPGFGYYDDFSVPGVNPGDQCVLGVPVALYEGVQTNIRATAADTLRVMLINVGTSIAAIPSSTWNARIFN
jgi:pectate lyase-like protein